MIDWLQHSARIVATAFCFACFGVGGVLLGGIVFPALGWFVRNGERRASAARRVITWAFRGFVGVMQALQLLRCEWHGLERLRGRGLLILANHPSLIDVVLLMGRVRHADCIVKGALARNPFTRGPVTAAGFVFNDSGTGLVDACVKSLAAGNNLIVFPEGTRTPASGQLSLQRGAARIALASRQDITPVRIRCTPAALGKGTAWYRVPNRTVQFHIEICSPIRVADFVADNASEALAARRLTDHLTAFFSSETRRAFP